MWKETENCHEETTTLIAVGHKIPQRVLKLLHKSISRNRLFAECQSITLKIFIYYKGESKTSQC